MKSGGAFTIIEVLVYCALVALLVLILSRAVGQSRQFADFFTTRTDILLRQHLFFDVLLRDGMGASMNESEWDSAHGVFTKYVIDDRDKVKTSSVGFAIKNNAVVRLEGDYDYSAHVWAKKSTCFLCPHMKDLTFQLERDQATGNIVGFTVFYTREGASTPEPFVVRLRNRELAC